YTETAPVDGESYYCEVKNFCGTVQSKVASLTVVEILSTTNPGNLTIADGANATFSVTASGEPNYSYQWQEDSGAGFIDIPEGGKYSGTKTAELKITNADKATFDGYKYQCIVSTSGTVCVPNVTSGIATLTIEAVDKILNQPTNIEVCFNDKVELSVEGKVAGLTYEWMYHKGTLPFVPIDASMITSIDATNKISTLSFDANDLDINNWNFKCIVSAAIGTPEESTEVSVRVLKDIAVTTVSEDFTPCLNSPFSISIAATG
ncbi:immunoglobulin domain-containing protein, partial [Marinifilum sp. D737]|uniref:immunoglobulin domain-containing protein n=1 Tax=Marinifilum sp. D737 TaxID=2969628 RepID=UPI002274C392